MANPLARFATFLAGVREEIRQVTWPARPEVLGSALVVFVGVALLGGYISLVDFLLSHAVRVFLR